MDGEILAQFTQLGAKPEEAIYRFMGKEDIYKRFLKKYMDDTSIMALRQGMEKKDAFEVFKAAHTLKGLSANLGLDCVQNKASEITELTREKSFDQFDVSLLETLMDELEECNQKICAVIEKYCQ